MTQCAKVKKVLFVLTSHDILGSSSQKTGYWLEELAAPYEILSGRGIDVVLASPKGGEPPADPESFLPQHLTYYTEKFGLNDPAQEKLAHTLILEDIKPEDFDAVFYPGGCGTLFDLVTNPVSIRLIESVFDSGKPLAFVGHSVAALRYAQDRQGRFLLQGAKVTGFRDSEEAGIALARMFSFIPPRFLRYWNIFTYLTARLPSPEYTSMLRLKKRLPFLVERMLKREGAKYQKTRNWRPFCVEDLTIEGGHLLTGQNPASSALIADRLADILTADEP